MSFVEQIDIIIHAAAFVNLLYPYEVLKGTNVTGTKNILLFARSGKIKPVHYISTNSVFPNGLVSNSVMCIFVLNYQIAKKQIEPAQKQDLASLSRIPLKQSLRCQPIYFDFIFLCCIVQFSSVSASVPYDYLKFLYILKHNEITYPIL